MKEKYITAYMDMAEVFAKTSEATRLKVGAIILKNDNIISLGINGTPAGWYTNACEGEDGLTLPIVRHAERAALDKLRQSTETSTGATLICTHAPCLNCAIEIASSGIKYVYYRHIYKNDDGLVYLAEKGIPVVQWK